MDVNMGSLSARETTLNRASVGQDILSKTLAKTEEGEQEQKVLEPRPAEGPKSSKQGRIDLYA